MCSNRDIINNFNRNWDLPITAQRWQTNKNEDRMRQREMERENSSSQRERERERAGLGLGNLPRRGAMEEERFIVSNQIRLWRPGGRTVAVITARRPTNAATRSDLSTTSVCQFVRLSVCRKYARPFAIFTRALTVQGSSVNTTLMGLKPRLPHDEQLNWTAVRKLQCEQPH